MKSNAGVAPRLLKLGACVALSGLIGLLAACGNEPQPAPAAAPAPAPATAPAASADLVKPLKVEPVRGKIGAPFTVTAEGIPPGKQVQFLWTTAKGDYVTEASAETIEFYEAKWAEKRVPLGQAVADAAGQVKTTFTAPDDYGRLHDIYLVMDGKDIARGGYHIEPEFTLSPQEGPVGTPITIKARGIGWRMYDNTWVVTYDNKFTGFVSSITTGGRAEAVIRASGPPGKHIIDVWHGHKSVPYLNWEQAPVGHTPTFQFVFTVTGDNGPPPAKVEVPGASQVVADGSIPRTTSSPVLLSTGSRATISPPAGPVLSKATLRVTDLSPNTPAEVFFMTARGSRVSGRGWALAEISLGNTKTDRQGTLTMDFQVPDDLGGWHTLKIVQGDKVAAEAAYYVQQSLVAVTPSRVKVGETFQVHVKGIGWTELDNTFTLVYDNSYIGYACGFNSNGDVTINMRASGAPGTHLIDIYPTVYQGHGKPPFMYQTPQLTALQDHPSLALGYRLPIFRLAIEVVE